METNNFTEYFVVKNNLFKGDIILSSLRKSNMKDCFLMYIGRDEVENIPLFVFHAHDGIKTINKNEIDKFLFSIKPIKIERFVGSKKARQEMIENILYNNKNTKYHFLINNTKYYKNFKNFNKTFNFN